MSKKRLYSIWRGMKTRCNNENHVIFHRYGGRGIKVSDEWALSRGNYTLSLTPKDGGPRTHFDGKWLDILKKQPDGFWKVYIDCVNDNAPPKVE